MDFLAVWFGISFVGAVAVPINARFKSRELAYVVENAELVALFTSDIVEQHTDDVTLLHEALPGLAESSDGAASISSAPPTSVRRCCSAPSRHRVSSTERASRRMSLTCPSTASRSCVAGWPFATSP